MRRAMLVLVPVPVLVLVCALAGVLSSLAVAQNAGQNAARDTAQDAPTPIASWSRTSAVPETGRTAAARGAAVFNNWCGACHGHDTERNNAPGTLSLSYKYRGELPPALEDRENLTADIVRFYVRNGVATMPFFRPTEVSDDDLEALTAYLVKD